MNYIKKNLLDDEKIVFETKLNWSEYLTSVVLVLLGIIICQFSFDFGILVILIGVFLIVTDYFKIQGSEFAVTNKRVLMKKGIFTTKSSEISLSKIEGIEINENFFDKLAGSGTVIVKGTGSTTNKFSNIDAPNAFKKAITDNIQ